MGSQASMTSLWSTQSMDEGGNARQKGVVRQNSYLSAVHSPLTRKYNTHLIVTVQHLPHSLTNGAACGDAQKDIVFGSASDAKLKILYNFELDVLAKQANLSFIPIIFTVLISSARYLFTLV